MAHYVAESSRRDLRDSALYLKAESLYKTFLAPGTGRIVDASELHVAPDGRTAVFSATIVDRLDGDRPTRIGMIDLVSGEVRVLTSGPGVDRSPKFSPNGRQIAFLSDRQAPGDFQLYLFDITNHVTQCANRVEGWVESLQWSPDGNQILLGVADHGADTAGANGAIASKAIPTTVPSWIPAVETAEKLSCWRTIWIYELKSGIARKVSPWNCNVWEAAWCGNEALVTVSSPGPSESLWYSARLQRIDISAGKCLDLYRPHRQLGWPAGSPDGTFVAVVEAVCSDRCIVAGDLLVINAQSGTSYRVDTHQVDIAWIEWRSEGQLLLAGHRGFETVIGVYDVRKVEFTETWSSEEITTAGRYVTISSCVEVGDCALVGEGFTRAPEVGVIRNGQYRTVKSFGSSCVENPIVAVERHTWTAADQLNIQGWLLLPEGADPFPLITCIHGGPVWHWRPTWLGRAAVPILMLLQRGFAIFFPNPRGSGGRGQAFASRVVGDMGGADAGDLVSGIDSLVELGIADPRRLGVMGHSYGGFMTAWLIGQNSCFAAAVTSCPITNYVTEHLISNIPHWPKLFLADPMIVPGGQYFERSPIMHVHKVKTPTLNVCGALDRSAPPEEAIQFHNALLENGVKSVLVIYPEEGHGVRKMPASLDYAARVVSWFEEHIT